jgi:hypothetical protein
MLGRIQHKLISDIGSTKVVQSFRLASPSPELGSASDASMRTGWFERMPLRERHEIVLADSLQDQKHRRRVATIGDEMRALGRHRISLSACQTHVLLRCLQEDPERALDHVERVVNVIVVMPRHLLARADLQLGDADARKAPYSTPIVR